MTVADDKREDRSESTEAEALDPNLDYEPPEQEGGESTNSPAQGSGSSGG